MNATSRIEIPRLSPAIKQMLDAMVEMDRRMKAFVPAVKQTAKPIEAQVGMADTVVNATKRLTSAFSSFADKLKTSINFILQFLGPVGRLVAAGISAATFIASGIAGLAGTMVAIGRTMWGYMVKLGDAMLADHLGALATGSTFGGFQAFRSVFTPVSSSPVGILERVRAGRLDQMSDAYVALRALKIRDSGDSAEMAAAAVLAAGRMLRSFSESQVMPQAQANRLTALFTPEELRVLRAMSEEELKLLAEKYRKASAQTLSWRARLGWAGFVMDVNFARQAVITAIEEKLASTELLTTISRVGGTLTKAIATFLKSDAGTAALDKMKSWMEWLGGELASGGVQRALDKIDSYLRDTVIPKVTGFIDQVIDIIKRLKALFGGGEEEKAAPQAAPKPPRSPRERWKPKAVPQAAPPVPRGPPLTPPPRRPAQAPAPQPVAPAPDMLELIARAQREWARSRAARRPRAAPEGELLMRRLMVHRQVARPSLTPPIRILGMAARVFGGGVMGAVTGAFGGGGVMGRAFGGGGFAAPSRAGGGGAGGKWGEKGGTVFSTGRDAPSGAATDISDITQLEGFHEIENGPQLRAFMARHGIPMHLHEWCADLVNAHLAGRGIKGATPLARSFAHWGIAVDPRDVRPGDVMEYKSGTHVGLATGATRIGAGGQLQVEMISGNTAGVRGNRMVKRAWYNASTINFRRGTPEGGGAADGGGGVRPSAPPAGPTRGAGIPATLGPLNIQDISGQAAYQHGQLGSVEGFIFHHTGGGGTPQSVVNTLNQRGLGVQYVMDREGDIFRTLPSGARGAHILNSEINNLSNANTEGMEIIAANDADVNEKQIASAKAFAAEYRKAHPDVQFFGHGEVNPSHKLATEGLTVSRAVREMLAKKGEPAPVISKTPLPFIPLNQRNLKTYQSGDWTPASAAPAAPKALIEKAAPTPDRREKPGQASRRTPESDHAEADATAGIITKHTVKIDNRADDHEVHWQTGHGINAAGGI
jgi:hypothetical protein